MCKLYDMIQPFLPSCSQTLTILIVDQYYTYSCEVLEEETSYTEGDKHETASFAKECSLMVNELIEQMFLWSTGEEVMHHSRA